MQTLNDLFLHLLKDVYYVEKKLTKALPKMAAKASAPELRAAIEAHLNETEGQVERLEQIFAMLDLKPVSIKCEAFEGLHAEAEELMKESKTDEVRDAGIIASAQAVEHYEIARYGTLCAFAEQLGMDDAADLLNATLEEEEGADEKLSALATNEVNRLAA